MSRKIDLTGKRFGRLVVTSRTTKKTSNGSYKYECKCDCGNVVLVSKQHLKESDVLSCGCYFKEKAGQNQIKAILHNEENNFKDGTYLSLLNQKKSSVNTSGIKGVSWHAQSRKWRAYIKLRKKQIYLGLFENLEDAAKARKEAEEKYFTPILEKYGRLNESKETKKATSGLQS